MHTITKSRLVPLIGACALVSAIACVDAPTAPHRSGTKAARDSVAYGDTLLCRGGWTISGGRVVCGET